jgi:hypothetical protein
MLLEPMPTELSTDSVENFLLRGGTSTAINQTVSRARASINSSLGVTTICSESYALMSVFKSRGAFFHPLLLRRPRRMSA